MNEGSSELKVGIFVSLSLLIGGVLIFVIGGRSSLLAPMVEFEVRFPAVDGLRRGSPVRIAGIDVGTVDEVGFGEADGQVHVRISIREEASAFVREGSVASVGSKGLLGDQLIDVTIGQGEPLDEGSVIPSAERSLLTSLLGPTGADAEGIVSNVNRATGALAQTLADPQVQQDLRDIVHNVATITALVHERDGTVHRLLADPAMADDVQATIGSIRETSDAVGRTMRRVDHIVGEVEDGDGTAHGLIYGQEGLHLVGEVARAAGEVAMLLREVRTEDNNAHALLYGDETGNLISNLAVASADLRSIIADVRQGRGTIGGLFVDPSIYEDIKRLVGDLQRNEILRSLVRYSIRRDETRPQVPRPEPASGD